MDPCSSADRVATAQRVTDWIWLCGAGSSWASDPSARGVTDVLRRCCWQCKPGATERGIGNGAKVLVFCGIGGGGPTVPLARTGGVMSVAAGGRPKGDNEGSTENRYGQGVACGYQVLLLCLHEHACHVHQLAVPRGGRGSGEWTKAAGAVGGVGYRVGLPKRGQPCSMMACAASPK